MAKTKGQRRPRAEPPKGFRDYFGAELAERKAMLDTIAAVYHRHGFDPLESPAIETLDALGKYLPDVDRPHAGVFAWVEDDDWLALRYDLTAPLARVAAQYQADLPRPYRRYAMGPVWRNEKPGPGRYRQFTQCDADTVGAASVAADAEICAMLAEALEAVGIPRGDYIVRVNNRKVLEGVFDLVFGYRPGDDDAQLGAVHDREINKDELFRTIDKINKDELFRTIDKFDKFGAEGVRQLLTVGRKDPSGDFTKGCGLTDAQADLVLSFLTARKSSNAATLHELKSVVGHIPKAADGIGELEEIAEIAATQGIFEDRIVIDPSVVRGLGYYTGPVFEAELTFEILDDEGRTRQFGSVAGGGRYDGLVERFTGQQVPATGVSIGVDRLLAALRAKGRLTGSMPGPVVVTVMDRARMADYFAMAAELRAAGIRAEVYLGNPRNFGNQLKYADKRAAPVAVIQGTDEAARGVVQLKDLVLGARIAASASLEEWKAQPAQTEVARADLVAGVRRLLDGAGQ